MQTTANYGLKKPEGSDVVDIQDFNDNADIIDSKLKELSDSEIDYGIASGTNTYTATITGASLAVGRSYKIKFTNANTGASTLNMNSTGAKTIQKSNGSGLSSGNIKAGQIVHLVYTGTVFQLLGEGGEYGTAQAAHVMSGYTLGTEDGVVAGTMPNYGGDEVSASYYGANTQLYLINNSSNGVDGYIRFRPPLYGYVNSGTGMLQFIKNMRTENIKAGVRVGSDTAYMTGTFTADATATALDIIEGKNAYVNGEKVVGTLTDYSDSTLPVNASTGITAVDTFTSDANGHYGKLTFKRATTGKINPNSVFQQTVFGLNPEVVKAGQKIGASSSTVLGTFTSDATAIAGEILAGKTAYVDGNKVTGAMPNNGSVVITPSTVNQAIAVGYHPGTGYVKGDANLVASNIKSGVSVFGVTGDLTSYKTYSGSISVAASSSATINFSGQPILAVIRRGSSGSGDMAMECAAPFPSVSFETYSGYEVSLLTNSIKIYNDTGSAATIYYYAITE